MTMLLVLRKSSRGMDLMLGMDGKIIVREKLYQVYLNVFE